MVGDYPTHICELPHECSSPLDLPGCRLSRAPAEHRPESIAYRLDSERGSFVYTGDAEYSESVVELARGAHTFLIECSFPDSSPVPGHLTPRSAARVAVEAGAERVVITHVYPAADALDLPAEVGQHYAGEVIVSEDDFRFGV